MSSRHAIDYEPFHLTPLPCDSRAIATTISELGRASLSLDSCNASSRLRSNPTAFFHAIALDPLAQCCHHTRPPAPRWCRGIMPVDMLPATGIRGIRTSPSTCHHIGTYLSSPCSPDGTARYVDFSLANQCAFFYQIPTTRDDTSSSAAATTIDKTRHNTCSCFPIRHIRMAWRRCFVCIAVLIRPAVRRGGLPT